MRPVQLEMTNFGPYRHEIIRFSEFDEAPLFLIGGDTGAGKSTLFDAMTVALFATTTGDRNVDDMRSTFAGPEDPLTQVTFYFQQGHQLYRIRRTLRQERAKRGGGTTLQEPKVSLVVVDKVGGQELEKLGDKIKEVATEIERILGLNAEQFKQIILLPQNDFSRFLKEDSKNKTQILKKIFGTGLYDRFIRSLEDRHRDQAKDLAKKQAELEGHFTSQVWSDQERQALAQQPESEKLSLAGQLLAQREDVLKGQEKTLAEAQKAYDQLHQDYQQAQDLAKVFEQLAKDKQSYALEIEEGALAQAERQKHLESLLFAQTFQELIQDLAHYERQTHDLQGEVKQVEGHLEEAQEGVERLAAQGRDLEAQATTMTAKEEELKRWQTESIHAEHLAQEKAALLKLSRENEQAQKDLSKSQSLIVDLQASLDQLESGRLSQDQLREAEQLADQVSLYVEERLAKVYGDLENLQQEKVQEDGRQQMLEDQLAQTQRELDQVTDQLRQALTSRRQLMIAQLQAELEDGQACMVCGSLEHPQVMHEKADEQQLKSLMEVVENLQKEETTLTVKVQTDQARLEEVQARQESLRQQIGQTSQDLANQYQALQDLVGSQFDLDFLPVYDPAQGQDLLAQVKASYQDLQKKAQEEQEAVSQYQVGLDQAKVSLGQFETKATQAQAKVKQVEASVDDLQARYPDLKELVTYQTLMEEATQILEDYKRAKEAQSKAYYEADTQLQGLKGKLETLTKERQKAQETQTVLEQELDHRLGADDALTQDLEQVKAWLVEVQKQAIPSLQEAITSYKSRKESLQASIDQGEAAIKGQVQPDLEALNLQLETSRQTQEELLKQVSVLDQNLKKLEATYGAAKTLQDDNQDRLLAYQEISDLLQVVKGNGGAKTGRLDLEVYVIRQYFQQILEYANSHYIGILTDNRYSFVLSEEGRGARDHYGLDINVYDQLTGSERSVKSLSGGETFIAALAIALSLSEVVQNTSNGALVEALFIDEGFGSLDKVALTKAIAVLEQIGENRMVGVISHVDDMKDGIAQQLLILKEHDGSSRIQVVDKR